MNAPSNQSEKPIELKSIKIKTFKRIKEVEFDLARVSILVGANGSGKSSIIQAAHLASCCIRQVHEIRSDSSRTIAINRLDYLPTEDYWRLGHKSDWGNNLNSINSLISFTFEDHEEHEAYCELRQARNAGISVKGEVPPLMRPLMRSNKYFTAYIPGISGIANSENKQSKKVVHRAASYGDSNIYMRNILLLLKAEGEGDGIEKIEEYISSIIGPVSIFVDHDEDKDLTIQCIITTNGMERPIELAGTGFLQLIQIFSYLYLFKPALLLIDEPDVHLHPPVQERLVSVLEKAAVELGTRIIIATHSPFIVRGRTHNTNVHWLDDGEIKNSSPQSVETALGWGALGKKILLISEDQDSSFLREILRQWPELEQQIAIYPRGGMTTLPKPEEAKNIYKILGETSKILIHRDRDALIDGECELIKNKYNDEYTFFWFPPVWDMESYLCAPEILAAIKEISKDEAKNEIIEIINKHKIDFKTAFCASRRNANGELYHGGGSPENEEIEKNFIEHNRVKGKLLLNKILENNQATFSRQELIEVSVRNKTLALDLKEKIKEILLR